MSVNAQDFYSDWDYKDTMNGVVSRPLRTPRNDNTCVASFEEFEKIRDSCKATVIVATTPKEKTDQEYRIWKSKQEQADRDWLLEQQLGFNRYD